MHVESWPIQKITPYARNPRNNQKSIALVKASINEYGWQQPIVVDSAGVIVAGHTRYFAAQELGMETVPVQIATDLTPVQIKAYRIMDNRSHEPAEWDAELLGLEIEDLREADFPMELTGFSADDLLSLGVDDSSLNSTDSGVDTEPQTDRAEELREQFGVQPGQVWGLGCHRLLCGDSTVPAHVMKVLQDDKPMLMVTDPPYGIEYDADWRNHAVRNDGSAANGRAIGKVDNDDRADWSEAYALFPGDVAYVWHPPGALQGDFLASLQKSGFEVRNTIIWAKNHFPIGRGHYHVKHEPCFYAVRKGGTAHWIGDRKQTTLWEIDKPIKSETGHSTQKPLECMARPIRNHDSEFIYDPFCGSGTSIIACENLGRICLGIEINPGYVAVSLQRFKDHTGVDPVLVG